MSLLVANGKGPQGVPADSPDLVNRGLLTDYLYMWIWPLVCKGACGTVRRDAVPGFPDRMAAEKTLEEAEKAWEAEKAYALQRGKVADLNRVLLKICFSDLACACSFGFVNGLMNSVARPLLLKGLIHACGAGEDDSALWLFVGALCAVQLLEGLTNFFSRHAFQNKISVRFVASYAGLAQVHSMRISTAKPPGTPEVGTLIGNDAIKFQQDLFSLSLLPGAIVQLFGGIAVLVYTIGGAGLVGLAFMIVMLLVNFCLSRMAKQTEQEVLMRTDKRMDIMTQLIHGIRAAKFCAWEESYENIVTEARRLETIPLKTYRVLSQGTVQIGRANPMIGCLFAFLFLALTVGDDPEAFKPADIFAALNVFLSLRISLIVIPEALIYFATMRNSIRRLQDFLEIPVAASHTTAEEEDTSACVSIKGAAFAWPSHGATTDDGEPLHGGNKVLHIDDLSVRRGSFTAIVGSVGSGKSSLVSALLGDMPQCGVDGGSKTGTVTIAAKAVAFVPQKSFVLSGTVSDNVALAEDAPNEAGLHGALAAVGMQEDLKRLPKGIQTEVGERGVVLSGGQQQRLSLARALYKPDADLLVADDPLSALDPMVAEEVFESLSRWVLEGKGSRTCVIVLNQLWHLPAFDHVVMLDSGRVVEQGAPLDLLASEGKVASFCTLSGYHIRLERGAPVVQRAEKAQAAPASKSADDDAVLVTAEEERVGAVPIQVLCRYIRGMGVAWFLLCNILVVATYSCQAFADLWLAGWVQDRERMVTTQSGSVDDHFYIMIYGCLICGYLVLLWTTSYCFSEGGVRSSRNLHSECLSTLLHAPVSFFEATPSGRICSRFTNDLAMVDKEIPRWMDNTWQLTTSVVMIGAQVAHLVPQMAPVVFVSYVLFAFQVFVINRGNRELRRFANTELGPLLTTVNEASNGRHVLRPTGTCSHFRARFCRQLDRYHRFSYAAYSTVNSGVIMAYSISLTISAAAASFIIVWRDEFEPSYAALALTYSFTLPYFLNVISTVVQLLLNSVTCLERLLQYSSTGFVPSEAAFRTADEASAVAACGAESWPTQGRIVFENVSLVYRPGLPKALNNVSFVLEPAEKVGVVGRSGAGKSSLMQVLFRLNEVSEGRILIDQVDVSQIGLMRLRKAIAIVPQDPLLIAGSVRLNLDPFGEHEDEELARVLDEVKLERKMLNAGFNASMLSHGERQLLTLGRTLLRPARIRVFDEPTSNIDAATDRIIQQLLRSASAFKDSTQLTIAHRLQTILDCHRILVMSDGRVAESGSPTQLLADKSSRLSALAEHAGLDVASALASSSTVMAI
eukprot:TRINITY_DN120988_c0_g1_i1.p1 TRINITY_DN120988_c0_g1~~TRINITY_DN120988_c0_g1_i1.p1  ORF type:complete len:1305 (+),score=261.90 TRINITY_DN120988_c0_g1_i1:86-4000(+)